ncbi:MAG: TubC N-terminal docking domain-related protein [Limisphaerales bacterium]
MIAHRLCSEVRRQGFNLVVRGDKLIVTPKRPVPPDLLTRLRAHKAELLAYLEGRAVRLMPDELPWLHTAAQVLAGEFTGADRSTRESLTVGLRSIAHPICREALDRINPRYPRRRARP